MEDATVAIYNMIGKKVTAVQKIKGQALIDIADLAKGVYFVRIETNSNVITKKINVIK